MPEQKKQTTKSVKTAEKPVLKEKIACNYWFEYTLVLYIGFMGLSFAVGLAMALSYLN